MNENLRDKRKDLYKSQEAFAALLGIPFRTYAHYEEGDRDIPTIILKKAAILLNTSADYLLGLTDDEKPPAWSKRLPSELKELTKSPPKTPGN